MWKNAGGKLTMCFCGSQKESISFPNLYPSCDPQSKIHLLGGAVKMAEEQDGVITFSSTNSLKEQQNGEQSLQNNF